MRSDLSHVWAVLKQGALTVDGRRETFGGVVLRALPLLAIAYALTCLFLALAPTP